MIYEWTPEWKLEFSSKWILGISYQQLGGRSKTYKDKINIQR